MLECFFKATIDEIICLKVNPCRLTATFKKAEKGISILTCRSWTNDDIKEALAREAAVTKSQNTRTLTESLQLSTGDLRPRAERNSH
mmetsp:Transcript_33324/g.70053  ORF Transcript_33324/g.70053 Transcript_33324/m.70053 type:complete len:87 (+) Transcript_33324:1749-2009(+)